ncbi:MAG: hypothetical protein QM764_21985 [Chitinophagaceae bacterium]
MQDKQQTLLSQDSVKKIMTELELLDQGLVEADGLQLKPSQCYYVGTDPFHILYNTNCPDSLKERIDSIVSFYLPK